MSLPKPMVIIAAPSAAVPRVASQPRLAAADWSNAKTFSVLIEVRKFAAAWTLRFWVPTEESTMCAPSGIGKAPWGKPGVSLPLAVPSLGVLPEMAGARSTDLGRVVALAFGLAGTSSFWLFNGRGRGAFCRRFARIRWRRGGTIGSSRRCRQRSRVRRNAIGRSRLAGRRALARCGYAVGRRYRCRRARGEVEGDGRTHHENDDANRPQQQFFVQHFSPRSAADVLPRPPCLTITGFSVQRGFGAGHAFRKVGADPAECLSPTVPHGCCAIA